MACEANRVRLLCMLSLTFVFFIVEVVVSRMTSSLSMLSDSFHMLSDVIALVVALVAVRFAEKTQSTNKNTFGWIRAEVMGALVNAVFLTALCFTIVLEAVERFTEPHEIETPQMVAGVGVAGLLVNLLGLCLFHGHAGHGHSHGGHSHGKKKQRGKLGKECGDGSSGAETSTLVASHSSPGDARQKHEITCKDGAEIQMNGTAHQEELGHERDSSSQLNMRGVFLHVLGDALGSVIVVVNALIFTFVWTPCKAGNNCINVCTNNHHHVSHCGNASEHQDVDHTSVNISGSPAAVPVTVACPCWVLYLDPTLCLIMVCILLYTTYPLLKESALILLQTVPKQVNVHRLNERLLSLEGVLAIHELHVWQLAGSRIIATAHIKCHDPASYMDVAKRIKDFFHDEGIHATTVQPEFVTVSSESRDSLCELSCRTQCAPKLCCGSSDKPVGAAGAPERRAAAGDSSSSPAAAVAVLDVISETSDQVLAVQAGPALPVAQEVESSL